MIYDHEFVDGLSRRITELEAERDRLREALTEIADSFSDSEAASLIMRARSALSPTPSGDISRGEAYAHKKFIMAYRSLPDAPEKK